MSYSAAVDISSGEAAFAIMDNARKANIFTAYVKADRHGSSGILPGLIDAMQEHNVTLDSVSEWLTGTGPGSFTGLRLMSSLVAGICFGKDNVKNAGIPSSLALASHVLKSEENASCAALFDGRNKEILVAVVEKKNGSFSGPGRTDILDRNSDFAKEFDHIDKLVSMEKDKDALAKVLPSEIFSRVEFFTKFPVQEFFDPAITFRSGINDLIYVRPAVFVEPKKFRNVN